MGKVQITKRLISNKTKETFKNALQEMAWDNVISFKQIDSAYDAFLDKFTSLQDKTFGKFVVTVISKTLKNPWVTKQGRRGNFERGCRINGPKDTNIYIYYIYPQDINMYMNSKYINMYMTKRVKCLSISVDEVTRVYVYVYICINVCICVIY